MLLRCEPSQRMGLMVVTPRKNCISDAEIDKMIQGPTPRISTINDVRDQYLRDEWTYDEAMAFLENWFGFDHKQAEREVGEWER